MASDLPSGDGSEKHKMLTGALYQPADPRLVAERRHARFLACEYDTTRADEGDRRRAMLTQLFGGLGADAEIEPPFRCDYGYNIFAGERVFMNFGCVVLDCARVEIGDRVLFGPSVHVYAASHPLDPLLRRDGLELAQPVWIGNDVWIGGHAVICPGVRIGDRAVIGAGSVVTRDVPSGMIAAGNPCRVIRPVPGVTD